MRIPLLILLLPWIGCGNTDTTSVASTHPTGGLVNGGAAGVTGGAGSAGSIAGTGGGTGGTTLMGGTGGSETAGKGGSGIAGEGGSDSGSGGGSGEAGASGAAGAAGAMSCSVHCGAESDCPCPTTPMITVVKADGSHFQIDATEVPNKDYRVFVQAVPKIPFTPMECNGNTDFTPSTVEFGCIAEVFDAPERVNRPVGCVDWCDAWAYCKWVGKRLCESPKTAGLFSWEVAEEWKLACGGPSDNKYPYGPNSDPKACNTYTSDVWDVGSVSTCEGGYTGLFDMSGNVSEWMSPCDNDLADTCNIAGGGFPAAKPGMMSTGVGCFEAVNRPRNQHAPYIGFRCCANLPL